MKKNIDFKALAEELAALEKQGKGKGHDLLIARVLHNMSPDRWAEFCKAYPSSNWGAIPLSELALSHMADSDANAALLEEELQNAIITEKFTEQLERELLRLERFGGELSMFSCMVHDAGEKCLSKLKKTLISILRENVESCDSMALDAKGHPLVLLPGAGPVRSRHLCETLQTSFAKRTKRQGQEAELVLGLVSIGHTEKISADGLLSRVEEALTKALAEPSRIFQIGPELLDERSTLVHSDEKRFLFFGGA
ncbi:MAG: hypothetical protein K5657_01555 [Desulfovibrio sp.]|nr:hypothetical protein [Desulfovibrio sp.]